MSIQLRDVQDAVCRVGAGAVGAAIPLGAFAAMTDYPSLSVTGVAIAAITIGVAACARNTKRAFLGGCYFGALGAGIQGYYLTRDQGLLRAVNTTMTNSPLFKNKAEAVFEAVTKHYQNR